MSDINENIVETAAETAGIKEEFGHADVATIEEDLPIADAEVEVELLAEVESVEESFVAAEILSVQDTELEVDALASDEALIYAFSPTAVVEETDYGAKITITDNLMFVTVFSTMKNQRPAIRSLMFRWMVLGLFSES